MDDTTDFQLLPWVSLETRTFLAIGQSATTVFSKLDISKPWCSIWKWALCIRIKQRV